MGRKSVRLAIQNQIQEALIPYVGTVFPARPNIVQEQEYTQTLNGMAISESDSGSSCVIVVNMPDDHRQMEAIAGRGFVNDLATHHIALEIWFANTGGDAIAAQLDYDDIIDGLFTLIRNNPTPGGSAVVWSQGEFKVGVDHVQGQPYNPDEGGTILINSKITYDALEWLAGAGV